MEKFQILQHYRQGILGFILIECTWVDDQLSCNLNHLELLFRFSCHELFGNLSLLDGQL